MGWKDYDYQKREILSQWMPMAWKREVVEWDYKTYCQIYLTLRQYLPRPLVKLLILRGATPILTTYEHNGVQYKKVYVVTKRIKVD